jgi:hypothetical protein
MLVVIWVAQSAVHLNIQDAAVGLWTWQRHLSELDLPVRKTRSLNFRTYSFLAAGH